jgi:tetratricopeptide (TPR) repeat protein
MGLILCPHSEVSHPFYIADLGVHIYSLEELCYVIYRYPLLVMDDFIDEAFTDFISDDLKLSDYLRRMERAAGHPPDPDDLLCGILEYSELYTKEEITSYREKLRTLRGLNDEEYAIRKADFMFEIVRYGQAIRYYNKALRSYGNGTGPSFASAAVRAASSNEKQQKLLAGIYESIGDSQANLMLYRDAYDSYSRACIISQDEVLLKKVYFLSLMDPDVENRKIYTGYLGDRIDDAWDEEYEAALHEISRGAGAAELDDIFDKDLVKRRRAVADILGRWKQEYRRML